MPPNSQLSRNIDLATKVLEKWNRNLTAGGPLEDCADSLEAKNMEAASELEVGLPLWANSLSITAERERHTRLRVACTQLLRTVGPKVDWACATYPPVHLLYFASGALASALGALSFSGAGDALRSQPPEQRASFFRQWRSEVAVVCQLLNAIADAPRAATSRPAPETFMGMPYTTFASGTLIRCLSWLESFYDGLLEACALKEEASEEHSGSGSRNGSDGDGDTSSGGCCDDRRGGGSGQGGGSGSGFISCEQEYGECVQLSESLVRLVIKLPRLQAALPAISPYAHRAAMSSCFLPRIIAGVAREWGGLHLTPEAAQRQLPAVLRYAATLIKALRAAAASSAGAAPPSAFSPDDIKSLCGGLVECMLLVGRVLMKHPQVAEGKKHLTRYLRTTGLLVFDCIPALQQGFLASNRESELWVPELLLSVHLLQTLEATALMDEAVRGGLGRLLYTMFEGMEAQQRRSEAAHMLRECARLCSAPQTASLALAVGAQGLLAAAVGVCRRIAAAERIESQQDLVGPRMKAALVLAATGNLLRAVCGVLDSRGGTCLATDHAQLLGGFHEVKVNHPGLSASATSVKLRPHGTAPGTWAAVQASLLPAIETASREQMAAAQAGEAAGMDKMFRDVAVSPWTCTNPGCTNLAGCSEGQLHFMTCSGCKEARYCCKDCQRSDWRRHKAACHILKESKGSKA